MSKSTARESINDLRHVYDTCIDVRGWLYKQENQGVWLLFHTAIDTLEDNMIAVEKFERYAPAFISLNPRLSLTGFIQSVYLALDAVLFLVQACEYDPTVEADQNKMNERYNEKKFFGDDLVKIRYVRHNTFGHPVKNTNGKRDVKIKDSSYTLLPTASIGEHFFVYAEQKIGQQPKTIRVEYANIIKQLETFVVEKLKHVIEILMRKQSSRPKNHEEHHAANVNREVLEMYYRHLAHEPTITSEGAALYTSSYVSLCQNSTKRRHA